MKHPQEHYRRKKLPVMEIFGPTIQGEGHLAGAQTWFIRFGLCDYACKLCDSIHAIDPLYVHQHATWMNQQDIAAKFDLGYPDNTPWVTLSGGNPAIHELGELVNELHDRDYRIAVETQGTLTPDWLHKLDVITVSPKSPGMGERFEYDKFNDFVRMFWRNPGFNIKVVVFDDRDIEFAAVINNAFVRPHGLTDRFYLSLGNPQVPTMRQDGTIDTHVSDTHRLDLLDRYASLSEKILKNERLSNARFFPQLHVLAWSNEQGR